jgi:hypothetical protein
MVAGDALTRSACLRALAWMHRNAALSAVLLPMEMPPDLG